MTLVYSSSLLSGSTLTNKIDGASNATPDNPIVCYQQSATSATADSTIAGFPISNALINSTSELWKSDSTATQNIDFDMSSTATITSFCVGAHNLAGAYVRLLVSDVQGGTYSEVIPSTYVETNAPIMLCFEDQSDDFFRFEITPFADKPIIGLIYVGTFFQLQRRIHNGHSPLPYSQDDDYYTGMSENGNFLGRVIKSTTLSTSIKQENITPAHFRSSVQPMIQSLRTKPFFFAWRPQTYSEETALCWTDGSVIPSNSLSNGMMEYQIKMMAYNPAGLSEAYFSMLNAGTDWSGLTQGLNSGHTTASFDGLATDGSGVWVAVATNGYAARSTDNGENWTALTQGLNSGTTIAGFTSVATDGSGVWVAVSAEDGFGGYAARSTDNGANWTALTQGLNSGLAAANFFSVATDGSGVWVAVADDGYASRSTDNGANWTALTQGLNSGSTTTDFHSVATDGSGVWVAVGQSGRASRSTDNGANWTALTQGLNSGSTSERFYSVATDGSGVWVATATSGRASRSTNNGANWTALTQGLNSGSTTSLFYSVATNSTGIWVAVSGSGYASRSSDNGENWSALVRGLNSGSTTDDLRGVASGSGGVWVAVGSDGRAARSTP